MSIVSASTRFGVLTSVLFLSMAPAIGARIEYQATRQNILPGATVPTNLPFLSQNVGGAGNTFTLSGPGIDSLSGSFVIHHNHVAPNGNALFTGLATYTGGTGVYAGATGQNVFAGIFNAATGATTVADYGFVDAPGLSGPDLMLESTFGTPAAVSPLSGGGMYDHSGVRKDTPFNDVGSERIRVPVTIAEPFPLDQNTADNTGGYLTTGPNGNFIRGTYTVTSTSAYDNTLLFAGFTFVTEASAEGWTVIGGSGVFAGRNVRGNAGATSGLEYVTDYAYVNAQRVPEPPTLALTMALLGFLVCRADRPRHMRR